MAIEKDLQIGRQAGQRWTGLTLALVALGLAAPARAQSRCYDQTTGMNTCPPQTERPADRAEGDFWEKRPTHPVGPRLMGPVVPGSTPGTLTYLPLFGPPTRDGKLSVRDLDLRPDGKGGFHGKRPGYRFDIDRDGTIHFDAPPPTTSFLSYMGLAVAFSFDLTDAVMRLAGMDPYIYDKGLVVDLTRPMRQKMGDDEQPRRRAAALRQLQLDLAALGQRPDLSNQQKRETLFQQWDDLLEDGTASGAREEIIRYAARQFPRNGPGGYSPDELARLNAQRRSRQAFQPYSSQASE
jgi:hypothetical protein